MHMAELDDRVPDDRVPDERVPDERDEDTLRAQLAALQSPLAPVARSGPRAFRNGVPAAAVRAPERTRESAPATGELARRFDACLEFQLPRLPEHVRTRPHRRAEVGNPQPGPEGAGGMGGQSA